LAAGLGTGFKWSFGVCCRRRCSCFGIAGGSPATSGGASGARRLLTLGRLSRLKIEILESLRGLFRVPEQGHLIALPWPCRFGWRWIVSILKRIRDQLCLSARLVSLNRTRRGAYNDVDSVNTSDGLVGVAVEIWLALMSALAAALRASGRALFIGNRTIEYAALHHPP